MPDNEALHKPNKLPSKKEVLWCASPKQTLTLFCRIIGFYS